VQYFIAMLLIGATFLLILTVRGRFLRWSLLATLVLLATFLALGTTGQVLQRGSHHWYQASPAKEFIFFSAMVLGMIAKYFWDLIEERRRTHGDDNGKKRKPLNFDAWDCIQPLLLSGIVFAGILSMLNELTFPSVLLSFQNGFFWQTVLKRRGRMVS